GGYVGNMSVQAAPRARATIGRTSPFVPQRGQLVTMTIRSRAAMVLAAMLAVTPCASTLDAQQQQGYAIDIARPSHRTRVHMTNFRSVGSQSKIDNIGALVTDVLHLDL